MRFLKLFLVAVAVLVLASDVFAQCRTCQPSGRPRLFPRLFAGRSTAPAPMYYQPAPATMSRYSAPSYQPAPVQYTIPQPVYSVAGYGRPVGYSFGGCPGGVCPR